jgi:DNA-binding FrmR family transcriptional regulator
MGIPARRVMGMVGTLAVTGQQRLTVRAYCVDVMKQISAVQSSLERANRVMLHNHLETCFSSAVVDGRGQAAVEELIEAVKFTAALTGPQAQLGGAVVGEVGEPTDKEPAMVGSPK